MTTMFSAQPPAGIIPILYAFFDASGGLDRQAMRRQMTAIRKSGAKAVALLGLATEVNKLTPHERRQLIDWSIEDARGQLGILVTVKGDSVDEQIQLANYAERAGANWLILQPPPREQADAAVRNGAASDIETYCADFFSQILAATTLPSGIQNAPEYLGVGLSAAAMLRLLQSRPNLYFVKGEASCVHIRELILALGRRLPVFNGRGGLELTDNLRAGCAGLIVAPDCFDHQIRIVEAFQRGDTQTADAAYRELLPAIVFIMQSLDTLICYGKRIAAWRLGLPDVVERAPVLAPTPFGLEVARRIARQLGKLPS